MKILVDTNIVVDALQKRENFAEDAGKILLSTPEHDSYIVANSVTDIYYLQHKYYHDKKTARQSLEKVLVLFEVLDITGDDCKNALRSNISDFEDAVLVESAKRSGMDCIITRNAKDFKNAGLPVYSPIEFLDQASSQSSERVI